MPYGLIYLGSRGRVQTYAFSVQSREPYHLATLDYLDQEVGFEPTIEASRTPALPLGDS